MSKILADTPNLLCQWGESDVERHTEADR